MLKGNGDKRLNEQHSISQDSGCEIDNILKKKLKYLFNKDKNLDRPVSSHIQAMARKALIALLAYITVYPCVLLPRQPYASLLTEVKLGHYLSSPIKYELICHETDGKKL